MLSLDYYLSAYYANSCIYINTRFFLTEWFEALQIASAIYIFHPINDDICAISRIIFMLDENAEVLYPFVNRPEIPYIKVTLTSYINLR